MTYEIRVYITRKSGEEVERDLKLLIVPRVGETLLVSGLGLTPGYKAIVTEVIHQPASGGYEPEVYLKAQNDQY